MEQTLSPLLYTFNGLACYLDTRAAVGGIICWQTVPLSNSLNREQEAELFAQQASANVARTLGAGSQVEKEKNLSVIERHLMSSPAINFSTAVSPFLLDGEGRSGSSVNRLVGLLSTMDDDIMSEEGARRVHFLLPTDGRLIAGNCPLNENPIAVPGKNQGSLAFATIVGDDGRMTGQQRTTLQSCKIQLEDMIHQPVTITGTPEFERALQNQAAPALANGLGNMPTAAGAMPPGGNFPF